MHVGVGDPRLATRAGLAARYRDPEFALAFARLVTHYVRNDEFLEDGVLLRNAGELADIPGILINGRFDFRLPSGTRGRCTRCGRGRSSWWLMKPATPPMEPALTDALQSEPSTVETRSRLVVLGLLGFLFRVVHRAVGMFGWGIQ